LKPQQFFLSATFVRSIYPQGGDGEASSRSDPFSSFWKYPTLSGSCAVTRRAWQFLHVNCFITPNLFKSGLFEDKMQVNLSRTLPRACLMIPLILSDLRRGTERTVPGRHAVCTLEAPCFDKALSQNAWQKIYHLQYIYPKLHDIKMSFGPFSMA
jgi:hypothetical protein